MLESNDEQPSFWCSNEQPTLKIWEYSKFGETDDETDLMDEAAA